MNDVFENRLRRLTGSDQGHLLRGGLIGLEKESLRVTQGGHIASTPHPPAFGSALTNPWITTDYSEALLEFITPPMARLQDATAYLRDLQSFVYHRLADEMLWATSMPCVLEGEQNIPIACYGTSNAGMMKQVYRRGLGLRYGRVMQVISGVHFNYSVPTEFWPVHRQLESSRVPLQAFISDRYFGLIRNLQRYGWMVPYLFGASPAVCKSFFGGGESGLSELDAHTLYEPFATSLRVSDIGYQNRKEKEGGLRVCYDNLERYVDSLSWAIDTPHPEYQAMGVIKNGEYQQLNANLLQIENEYYSSIRPKQIPLQDEKPTLALRRRGVRYVELRSADVCAFEPIGVREDQLHFLEAFLLYCLLQDSPPISAGERAEIDYNLDTAARRGREPGLTLRQQGGDTGLQNWARDICTRMQGVCELLDGGDTSARPWTTALAYQRQAVEDADHTPSARILSEMRERKEPFFAFALRQSQQHRDYFMALPIASAREQMLQQEARQSVDRQREIEAADEVDFEQYLQRYFAQRA